MALKQQGYNVRILERSSTSLVSTQGAGLNAGPDVQRFMREFDRTGLPYSLHPHTAQILNSSGTVTRTMESDQWSTDWSSLYYRLRANFDGLESGYGEVPPKTPGDGRALYMDGHSVSGVQYEHNTLSVQFHGPEGSAGSFDADLVIAADGPSSTVRQILAPEVERKYVGYCGWRGTVLEDKVSDEAKKVFNEGVTACTIERSLFISLVFGPL